jgi:MFS family permease
MSTTQDVTLRPAPPAYFRWTVLVFASLAMFGNYYIYDSINPLVDIFKEQLGYSNVVVGWLNSIYSVAAVLTLLIGGVTIDRIGTKKATFVFAVICLAGAMLTAVSGKPAIMLSGRFLLGIGAESLIVAVTTALAKWFKGKELSFAFGLNLLIARFGSVAADNSPTWASWAFTEGPQKWQSPLFIAVGAGLVCVVASIVYWMLEGYAERKYALGKAGAVDKLEFKDIFKFDRSYWYIVGLCFAFYSAVFPFRTFAIDFFINAHGASRQLAGSLNGFIPLTAMYATPLFGLMADRFGKRAFFMFFGSILFLPVFLMMGYTHISLWVPVTMLGIAFSLIPAIMWPSVAYLVEENKLGTGYALMTLIQQIGFFAMNWMIGESNDRFGAGPSNPEGYNGMLWLLSVLGFFGMFFALMLRRSETSDKSHGLETITTKTPATV